MKRLVAGKRSAFILANAVIAATLIVMAVVWLGLCENQLKLQREKMRTSLRAARVAKEATDHAAVDNHRLITTDHDLVATVSREQVVVTQAGKIIYEVRY
ncbi:hypothetical protein [uncultured Limosilactobacillus sp.]|uniref:hypothetical protein n=1 Tax=uncultured Limosilactobacillus sp. TaxID=2837629 RepID=UPI0025E00463|nr:hypothetical protein [uncultured Limosilactobacillus sp.]